MKTSILLVLLKQFMSPTGPNKIQRGITPARIHVSMESNILGKGNNSCKSRLNATKVKLVLYYVKINPYTKFQVNITKDGRERPGKLNFCNGNNSIKEGQTRRKLNMTCITSRQIHI